MFSEAMSTTSDDTLEADLSQVSFHQDDVFHIEDLSVLNILNTIQDICMVSSLLELQARFPVQSLPVPSLVQRYRELVCTSCAHCHCDTVWLHRILLADL